MEKFVNKEIFFEFLKILFSTNNNELNTSEINKLTKLIQNLLEEYNNNFINIENFLSPLRDINFEQKNLWTIQKIIKIFLKLKSNIIVYRSNDYEYKSKELYNNLKEKSDKELTFDPDISESSYIFDKDSKFSYYNKETDFLNRTISNTSHKPKRDFNITYKRFMQDKKRQEKVLEQLREIKKKKESKKCTHIPKISHYSPNKLDEYSQIPVFERLYNMRKINKKLKSIRNSMTEESDFIEDKNDKIKVSPFSINDSNEEKKDKFSKSYRNIIDNIYLTIEIKVPNGQYESLKIYKDQTNIKEIIFQFCEKNNIDEEERKIIFNKIFQYNNSFFERNSYENTSNLNNNEEMDTNDNTYNNLSKKYL